MKRVAGGLLVVLSVYFVVVIALSGRRLSDGSVEFIPWMLTSAIFAGLSYLFGRLGWRLLRPEKPDSAEGAIE